MAANEYLLTFSDLLGDAIRLAQPCVVGHGPDGEPIPFNALDPRSFGRSFLAEAGPDLVWHARAKVKSLDKLQNLYGFHCGAIVSPRARDIIEGQDIPNIEFIPLKILYQGIETELGTWWFLNVFNWNKLFDLERSKVSSEEFHQPVSGLAQISRRFGEKLITDWERLEVSKGAVEDGLVLAEAPSERIWSNVFISERLAEQLNDGLSKDRRIHFEKFWLDGARWPQTDQFGLR